jgi:hypothetical protein
MRHAGRKFLGGGAIALLAACGFDGLGGSSPSSPSSPSPPDTSSAVDASAGGAEAASDGGGGPTFTLDDGGMDGAISDASNDAPDGDASTVDASEAGSTGALELDGIDDFARVLRQVQADFTLEAWIRTTTSRAGSNFYDGLGVIYADVAGSANDFGTSILNGKLAFGTVDLTIQSTSTVTTGVWVHVAAVRVQASGTMRVLVNGTQEAQTTSGSTAQLNAPSTINFGGNTIDNRYFKGTMDEVRIWNVARTTAQIQGAMKTRLAGNEAGLVGYWRFDDGSGSVAIDSSGSANSASLGAGTVAAQPAWVSPGAF